MKDGRPRIAILYHFFPPDDVVSARQFGGLASGLAARGWDVEVLTSNRLCHGAGAVGPKKEEIDGVRVRRIWRPGLAQDRGRGRIINALWMIFAWCGLALRRGNRRPQVILSGTDPVFSAVVAWILKGLSPKVREAHWAFDLYPEAAVADEIFRPDSRLVRLTQRLMRAAYRSFDLIVDIGPCMRERIAAYGPKCPQITLVPWALVEPAQLPPPDPAMRTRLFGDCTLALLYSGSFGRAHEFQEFIDLARCLRNTGIRMGFAVRGRRLAELQAALTPEDSNVRLLPFAAEAELERHLAAADIHLASLRANWTGIVVPSKFFGSLAIGRPVLFAGDPSADLAQWITEEQVGWVLQPENIEATAETLRVIANEPTQLMQLKAHCHAVYSRRFRKELTLDSFDRELRRLIPAAATSNFQRND